MRNAQDLYNMVCSKILCKTSKVLISKALNGVFFGIFGKKQLVMLLTFTWNADKPCFLHSKSAVFSATGNAPKKVPRTTLLRVFYFFEPKNTPAVSCSLVNNHKNAMKVDFCNIRLLKTGGGSWYNACVIGGGLLAVIPSRVPSAQIINRLRDN